MKDSSRSKCAGQNDQCNDWKKTSQHLFKIFAADHTYSESSDKTFLVSLFELLLFRHSIKICIF